jgi:hypothetical protein
MQTQKALVSGPSLIWFIALVAAVFSLWLFFGWFALAQHHVEPGVFGDMFGAANALFSALAFAALIYTVLLQREELRLQRQELAENRAELKGQREQLEFQSQQMGLDAFESSFFRVLGVLGEIVSAIDLTSAQYGRTIGRDCFKIFYQRFKSQYHLIRGAGHNRSLTETEVAVIAYMQFYEGAQGDVGHYFRTLYNLVKLVDRSSVQDKHFYTNLIRAQLSNQETLLLFYNCVSGPGLEKFKPLVEKYALLKNMPREQIVSEAHLVWFLPSAFGKDFSAQICTA